MRTGLTVTVNPNQASLVSSCCTVSLTDQTRIVAKPNQPQPLKFALRSGLVGVPDFTPEFDPQHERAASGNKRQRAHKKKNSNNSNNQQTPRIMKISPLALAAIFLGRAAFAGNIRSGTAFAGKVSSTLTTVTFILSRSNLIFVCHLLY